MAEPFTRFDERLIHGQVMVAWQPHLKFTEIGIIDDALAGDEWERELLVGAAGDIPVKFASAGEAVAWYNGASPNLFVLLRSFDSLRVLTADGGELSRLNLGGVHHREGRRKILDYLYVSQEELTVLRELADSGVILEAQDVPQHEPVQLNQLFAEGRLEFDNLSDRDS